PGDLLEGAQLAGEGKSLPAMLPGQLDGVQVGSAGRLDGLERIMPVPLPPCGVGRDVLLGEGPGARHDGTFFGRQNFIQHRLLSLSQKSRRPWIAPLCRYRLPQPAACPGNQAAQPRPSSTATWKLDSRRVPRTDCKRRISATKSISSRLEPASIGS